MRPFKKIWLGIGAMVGLLAVGQVAAQVAQDFPNLKGGNLRTGRNGDPANSGPGPANLRWYATNAARSDETRLVIDNTDTIPPYVHPVYGQYQTNTQGETTSTAGWTAATGVFSPTEAAAEDALVPQVRPRIEAGLPRNFNLREQYYLHTAVTNSRLGGPQTAADNPGDLRSFTWQFRHPANAAGQYALYVYLPIQPTLLGGVRLYSQRYYVYQITFAGNRTRTEIVDTYASGGGWVRLGAGGQPTSAVFGYDGTNPIQIRLFNTIPRNDQGQLMLPNGAQNGNGLVVYADAAMAVPQPGNYVATPTSARLVDTDINSTVVTGASNERETGWDVQTGDATSSVNSIVTNYEYQNGNVRWTYRPSAESESKIQEDDEDLAPGGVPGVFVPDATVPHVGNNSAKTAPVTLSADPGQQAWQDYTLNVRDSGSYAVYAYIPPTGAARPLAHGARYEVRTVESDGSINSQFFTIDQSTNRGWVRLGTRFDHDTFQRQPTDPVQPIQVRLTNFSADPTDNARFVYADAIRVVGETSLAITSSPVHANALVRIGVGTDPVERKVVFIADEGGRIHCLDANGNGDGTTRVYWTYPSIRDGKGYDPNHGPITTGNSAVVAGEDWSGPGNTAPEDRGSTAEMPQGFELSTASVQRVTVGGVQRDYLYIASSNGRIYCIDVAGRGDNTNTADPQSGELRTIGTTTRVWTYPNTYPSPNAVASSPLGPFRGSVIVDNGVVYAPAAQGRIYALNAMGNANKTTTVNWTYPALNQPTLGAIQGTPSLEFGRLYFGTMRKLAATDDIPGQVIALNLDGTPLWSFQRTGFETGIVNPDIAGRTDDFRSSLITVPGSQLGAGNGNTVFALNENRKLYALNADTGAVVWANDELQTGATASLGFTHMLMIDNTGTQSTLAPAILVPGSNGQLSALFADRANLNVSNGRLGWGASTTGDRFDASLSVSNGWMYAANVRGYLYALSTGPGISVPDGGFEPIIPPNDPRGNLMRKAKIKTISRDLYRRLRQPEDAPSNQRTTYDIATAGTPDANKVYEWGETAYVMVYDFPYLIEDPDNNPVDPPIVNISFNADGRTVRGVSVQSRRFLSPNEIDDDDRFEDADPQGQVPGVTTNPLMNGYAVLAFPLQNGGANAVPPGAGEISFNIQTAGLTTSGALSTISVSPNLGPIAGQAWSRIAFRVANPLAIVVPNQADTFPGQLPTNNPFGLGLTTNPSGATGDLREEALMNGSIENPNTGNKLESKLTTATPLTHHGSTGKTRIWVYDRSFMGLLRPGGRFGLDNVRMDRRDLSRQGGEDAVFKRFDPTIYAGFEDLPLNYPNTSIDYPDVRSEQIRIIKDPNGSAENPIFSGVALLAPRGIGPNGELTEDTLPAQRVFVPTEFEIDVEIPRFQPPASFALLQQVAGAVIPGSNGNPYRQGHIGRLQVFVDSLSNGQLDMAQREAYRSFNLTTSIDIDERLRVTTPNVDLGTLPGGTGYSPLEARPGRNFNPNNPLANSQGLMHPWRGSAFEGAYKEFGVVNEGNVNLLNLRAATQSTLNSPNLALPLNIDAPGNDPLSWLNGFFNVHTSLDNRYSSGPTATNRPIALQKPRVSDRAPTTLMANTKRRVNVNLGLAETLYNMTADPNGVGGLRFPDSKPKVGVSIPIGFPAGKYTTRLVIIEDTLLAANSDYGATPLTTEGAVSTPIIYPPSNGGAIWNRRPRLRFNGVRNLIPGETPEPATEPGILLSFNVAETRLTNSYTPLTAPMVDNLAPSGGDLNLRFQNTQPAATRDANGNLIVAWASNRTAFGNTPAANGTDYSRGATKLFFSSLDSGGTFSGSTYNVPEELASQGSFLRDLGLWLPASNGQWFRQAVGNYPASTAATYFGNGAVDSSARYSNPAFPTSGYQNPFGPGGYSNAKMAFVGRANRVTPTGTLEESRLFVASVAANANGALSVPEPAVSPYDTQVAKSEASVLQTSNTDAIVFYTGAAAGQSWAYYTRLESGGFRPSSPLPFGQGFLSTGGVSATGRTYDGLNQKDIRPVAEVVFTGLLKGRPYPEAYIARANFAMASQTAPVVPMRFAEKADGTLEDGVFEYLPGQMEQVTREGASLFRTRGVAWNRGATIALHQRVNNVTTSLLVDNTRTADRETGLISYESRLGGRVIFDPAQGTIRFTAAAPTGSAQIFATYTPRFLRISNARVTSTTNVMNPASDPSSGAANQGGGASKTTALYDRRYISDTLYWRNRNNGFVTNEEIPNDRLVVTWNRAAGSGATARPFLTSLRFGVDLTYRLPTLPDGTPGYFAANGTAQPAVTGVYYRTGPTTREPVEAYQMDPANGRIYLPSRYEGMTVEVDFVGIDDSGTLIPVSQYPVTATYVSERSPEPVPIETAVNESGLTAFLDPFNYVNDRRPPLVWFFWTSTRGGVPDIYFETIAPQWAPTSIAK